MALSINFKEARLIGMSLAKVGNSLREEPLQTSKALCQFEDSEADLLTHCFLKSFRSLELHRLRHHTDVEQNEMHRYATGVFADSKHLVENGSLIARHLYEKSNHPNIKPGDLCVALIADVIIGGQKVQALSVVKSESQVPFLQISSTDEGDLQLKTQHGIYPEKIDKGCLIVNHDRENGYAVYLFDKSGGSTYFWNRDFIGAEPVRNDDYLTKRYSELCTSFAKEGLPEETLEEDRLEVASKAISAIENAEEFRLEEFKTQAFEKPEIAEQFEAYKKDYEDAQLDEPLKEEFTVSKPEAAKAKRRLKAVLKLDTGVRMQFSSGFITESDKFLERGFDKDKQMNFVKVYFHEEVEK